MKKLLKKNYKGFSYFKNSTILIWKNIDKREQNYHYNLMTN